MRAVPSWPAARSSTATRTPPAPTTCTGAPSTASTFGPATAIDPYNDPFWSTIATGSLRNNQPILYRGALPAFYSQLSSVTGMFYRDGRLYYTRSGSSGLYYRSFSVDSGIVGAVEYTVASSGFNDVAGTFVAGNNLYWASAVGR